MLRCNEPAGSYRVTSEWLGDDNQPRARPARYDLGPHLDVLDQNGRVLEAAPFTETDGTFEGELCAHEVAFVTTLPGKVFNGHRRHTLTALGKREGRK